MKPRALFSGTNINPVIALKKRLGEAGKYPPRNGSWLMGANATEPDEEAEAESAAEAAQAEVARELAMLREQERQIDVVRRRYLEGIQQLEQVLRDLPASQAEDTVELACLVARAVVGRELALDRGRTAILVTDMLRLLDSPRDATVRLNAEDLDHLRTDHPELFASPNVAFVEDDQLSTGGCVVETPKRIVDASVETRLSAVRAQLEVLLHENEQQQADEEPQ